MWWVASFIDAHTAHATPAELRRCLRCVTIGASRWRYWLKLPWRLPGQAGFIFFLRRCLPAVLLRCSARRRWSDTEGCLQIRQLARAATRHHPTSRQRCCSARPADEPPPAAAALGLTARAISAGGCAHMAARARRLRSRGEARGSACGARKTGGPAAFLIAAGGVSRRQLPVRRARSVRSLAVVQRSGSFGGIGVNHRDTQQPHGANLSALPIAAPRRANTLSERV